jgi:hypothetical protein
LALVLVLLESMLLLQMGPNDLAQDFDSDLGLLVRYRQQTQLYSLVMHRDQIEFGLVGVNMRVYPVLRTMDQDF